MIPGPSPAPIDGWKSPVLGYAARDVTDRAREAWDDDKRRAWAIVRSDVDLILSVDDTSWPSVLSEEQQVILDMEVNDLCPNLEKLRKGLTSIWSHGWPQCWIVAVSVLTENWGEPERTAWANTYWAHYSSEVVPAALDPSWPCLGYDVADDGLFSSLTTMGGGSLEETPSLKREWSRHLNCYNLFDDPRLAWEFKLFSDGWIKEHAPFFVYGLWQVQTYEAS